MKLLMRTNNSVLINFATALLRDRGLKPLVLDQHMSQAEGSVGALPRRIAIADGEAFAGRRTLIDAGLGHELAPEDDDAA